MRHHRLSAALIFALCLGAPARADMTDGMREDLGEAFRQLFEEMQPHLEDALKMLEGFEIFEAIDDPRHYQLPEILPNGDIIIRRRPDAPEFHPKEAEPQQETDQGTIDL